MVGNKLNINTVVLVVAIGVLFYMNNKPAPAPGPTPDPVVTVDVAKAAHTATVYYGSHLGDAMEKVADDIEAGKIVTAEQLSKEVRRLTEAARNQAFYKDKVAGELSYGELDVKNIPYEKFDESNRSKVAAYLREKAKGHRRVK